MSTAPVTSAAPARVLANLHLPALDGIAVRSFGDYTPTGPNPDWRPETERRSLKDILPLIPAAERPDALVISSPEYLAIPPDLADFPGMKILLITDWNVCLRFLPDLCALFDFCFTDWPGLRLLRKAGVANVHHQPLFGHNPADFKYLGLDRNLDVSFCGNLNAGLHRERNRLLARVARWSGDRPVHLRQAFNRAYIDVLNRSKLVFNYSIRGEANMRLFEAMACGAVPLVEASNQEVASIFQEGKHYLRYHPERLESQLDAWLAEPEKLAAIGNEARIAVARQTKAEQIRALLMTAGREAAKSPGNIPVTAPTGPAPAKALLKLRVLGSTYTMAEALAELQERAARMPELGLETLPGALLTLWDSDAGPMPSMEKVLDVLLTESRQPPVVLAYLRMHRALVRKDWTAVLDCSDRCLRELEAPPATDGGTPSGSLYGRFYPPIGLGKGFNTDINHAFREDIEAGGPAPSGYVRLLKAHCLEAKARALLALARPPEALACAEAIPTDRFVSLDPRALIAEIAERIGDPARLRLALTECFREKPLDTGIWDKLVDALMRSGDRAAVIALLEDLLILAQRFLPEDQAERVRAVLVRERS